MIDIQKIGQRHIEDEEQLLRLIRSSKLDDQSKESVLKRTQDHTFYSFTLSTREKYVRDNIGWWDIDARERFVNGLYSRLIHRLSSKCCSNYKRPIHKDRSLLSLAVIEHHSRTTGDLIQPHIHSTIAVSNDWNDRFLSCFQRSPCREHFSLDYEMFSGDAIEQWKNKVSSTQLEVLPTGHDKYNWIGYCIKQVDTTYQGGGSTLFINEGLGKRTAYQ
jgi:hypothetical protein